MRYLLLPLVFLSAACDPDPDKEPSTSPPSGDSADGTTDSDSPGDSDVPPDDTGDCECDDGLWCNGEEACDDDGNCVDGTPPEPEDDGDPCTVATTCDDDADTWLSELDLSLPACAPLSAVPTVASLDYAYAYWPKNFRPTETWPTAEVVRHFLTGHYGATWDDTTGSLNQLGAFTDGLGMTEALGRENSEVEALKGVTVRYEAGPTTRPVVATSFLGTESDTTHRSRTVDGGRFMNRLWIPTVGYAADGSLSGQLQLASSPRHLVLTHSVLGRSSTAETARIVVEGELVADLTTATWLVTDRVLTLTDAGGDGWLFAVYDQAGSTTTLSIDGSGAVVAEAVASSGASGSISLLMTPTTTLEGDMQAFYIDPESVATVQSTLLDRDGNAVGVAEDAPWDPSLGAFRATMGTLQDAGGPSGADYSGDPSFHHWHGRHTIQITSSAADDLSVPVAMHGTDQMSWYIVGGAPSLRDLNGEPVGVPLQISKNWHEGRPNNWYHLYTQPTVAAGDDHTLELTMASSKWGDVYAASHAQLSLIGWSTAGGHWDETALGAFGESITYDPDVNLGRSMQDDVRPFLVDAKGEWTWTGNVGGADFLRYATESEWYWVRRVARVRSAYTAVGPNLTDVTYSGVTSDGRIRVDATPQLIASDDLVRTYVRLSFEFLEDVTYDRLAFFQVAADNYADNGFGSMAYGNAAGVLVDTSVRTSTTPGYASESDRGIELSGDDPWVFLYNNSMVGDPREDLGNVGYVIRHFEADIGGTIVTTPRISLYQTYNGRKAQTSFELSLPYEDGAAWCGAPCGGQTNFIPAGSTVEAVVEYLVPPARGYYGTSDWLTDFTTSEWNTSAMMLQLASEGALEAEVSVGTLVSTYPTEVAAAEGSTAGELSLSGGLGFRPVSFSGLVRHDGWKLERRTDGDWETVDQSSDVGNDWWQATHDPATDTWKLTYSVPVGQPQELRLVWDPS